MFKYSLVVPTLNRSHLLDGALRALALLEHDSFEVIVSNNSSTDDTQAVAERYARTDSRFKHIKTDRKLCMSDHWEFALKAVSGDYFLFVGDDDSFDRNILRVLDHYLARGGEQGIFWKQSVYYYDSWFQKDRAGKLCIPPCTGSKRIIPSAEAIKLMFDMDFYGLFPLGTSFCFNSAIVRSIVEQFGAFFLRPYPDYTSTMMYLPSIDGYQFIDMALSVMGKSKDSNASANAAGPKERAQEFIREHDSELYPHVPLNYHLGVNGEAECVKAVQAQRQRDLSGHDIDWVHYYRVVYEHLVYGAETLENEKGSLEFIRKLLQMPVGVQAKVLPYVTRGELYRLRQRLKHYLRPGSAMTTAPVPTNDVHAGHTCKTLPDITACSRELAEHNSRLGYY